MTKTDLRLIHKAIFSYLKNRQKNKHYTKMIMLYRISSMTHNVTLTLYVKYVFTSVGLVGCY